MKKLKLILSLVAFCASFSIMAQIAINTDGSATDASAMLDIKSSDKGFLPPRMVADSITAISDPAVGLTVYNTTSHKLVYYDGTQWKNYDGTSF